MSIHNGSTEPMGQPTQQLVPQRPIKSPAPRSAFCTSRQVPVEQGCPHVKKKVWGGEFWSDKYFIASVGQHGSEETIRNHVKE